ncbi:MAG: ABC transporter permease [Eubacteriales bacterium]|nr:ABC transporter permease [Eubacteriales bacterium]
MSFLKVFSLKMKELLISPALLAAMVALPVLMGLAAGAANLRNQSPQVRLSVTDLDQTPVSRDLVDALKRQGWDILEVGEEDILRLVDGKAVEGALVIERGFAQRHDSLISSGLTYTPAEGTLSTNMVLDTVSSSVIPLKSRSVFLKQAVDLYRKARVPLPADFEKQYDQRIQSQMLEDISQDFEFVGEYREPTVLTYVVNDYSMEVLFLGVFSLLGSMILSSPAMRRRLAASAFGLRYDYTAALLALFVCGLAQIFLYMGSMRALMAAPVSARELFILAVFLLMSLAFSQVLALLDESVRLYIGLIVLLLMSVAGGCFIQLPQQLIRAYGQYIPQGWTLAALRAYPVPHPVFPIGVSLAALFILYHVHAWKVSRPLVQ